MRFGIGEPTVRTANRRAFVEHVGGDKLSTKVQPLSVLVFMGLARDGPHNIYASKERRKAHLRDKMQLA